MNALLWITIGILLTLFIIRIADRFREYKEFKQNNSFVKCSILEGLEDIFIELCKEKDIDLRNRTIEEMNGYDIILYSVPVESRQELHALTIELDIIQMVLYEHLANYTLQHSIIKKNGAEISITPKKVILESKPAEINVPEINSSLDSWPINRDNLQDLQNGEFYWVYLISADVLSCGIFCLEISAEGKVGYFKFLNDLTVNVYHDTQDIMCIPVKRPFKPKL